MSTFLHHKVGRFFFDEASVANMMRLRFNLLITSGFGSLVC